MSLFNWLFGKRPTEQQAVLVHLDGKNLPNSVYQTCDLVTLEDKLIEAISCGKLGELDGNEVGPEDATIFMYGVDAEKLFAGIEKSLRDYPLCQNARVVIRKGGPGSSQREIKLPLTQ